MSLLAGDATVLEIAKVLIVFILNKQEKLRVRFNLGFNANPKSSSNIIYYLRVTIRAKNLL